MANPITRKYIVLSLWLSLAISILVHFSSLFDEFVSSTFTQQMAVRFFINALLELSITFTISFILFWINFYILKPLQSNKKINWINFILAFAVSFGAVLLLSHYLFALKKSFLPKVDIPRSGNLFITKDFFLALVVIICIYVIRLIFQNQKDKLEIQSLKIENLQRQFDALKNQVSPHFLFNSLSSLKTLINESPAVAQEYLNHLSSVLRYTLQANENRLVSLSDELQFVESYFFLIKLRFTKNINLVQSISNELLAYKVPPLALQILLENAIRHNEISKRNSLEISITTTSSQTLIVSNTINKKMTAEPGAGVGLANLSNQYRILGDRDIAIRKEDQKFIVEIPLLA
ncbi:MAG: histidine kinase [Prolixibacteraceae bacterium]|nr:histidine kinase [Prolixibacteraceae bacterium]